jgi:pyruvate dehydrogenase E1 component alpha subunit
MTYRWKGHSKSDKNLYRTREEIDEWRAADPIVRFEGVATQRGLLTAQDVDGARAGAREAVRSAVREAMAAPDADPAVLVADVAAAVYHRPVGSDVRDGGAR